MRDEKIIEPKGSDLAGYLVTIVWVAFWILGPTLFVMALTRKPQPAKIDPPAQFEFKPLPQRH